MTVLQDLRTVLADRSARRRLQQLTEQIGRAGLSAAAEDPGLAAVVDQHAAAVRDIVQGGPARAAGGGLTTATLPARFTGSVAVRLAAYSRSLLEKHRRETGWVALPHGGQWQHADAVTLRLLGVCHVARQAGLVRT
ncbi:MAG: DUF6401 family natural product biosynthesis protein [Pseudonocardia sp.]|nr:DUF6401 family natural product biosynthesis protein [Pseudonocardia sp.]